MQSTRRLAYIDGLRGLAVLMVMLSHSVWKDLNGLTPLRRLSAPRMTFDIIAHEGFHGVSLFLVVSGFCLSYPVLKRRRAGVDRWFDVREFFGRRCVRILPPYYAALAAMIALTVLLRWGHATLPPSLAAAPLTAPNVLSHILLVHNLTPWYGAIDGSFWSLGLEWQWYFLFPLLLAVFVRSRWWAVCLCLVAGIAWHLGTHDLWQVWHATESAALPERLFEFCCGIGAAQIVLAGGVQTRLPRLALSALLLLPIIGAVIPAYAAFNHALFGAPQPFYGLAFGALIILASGPGPLNALLSCRLLSGLGVISYSLYLIHQPVIEAVEMSAPGPLQAWYLAPIAGISVAVLAGIGFHFAVERPFLSGSLRTWLEPRMTRLFGWTGFVQPLFGERQVEAVQPRLPASRLPTTPIATFPSLPVDAAPRA